MNKEALTGKLKKGSLWICIVCVLAVLFNVTAVTILCIRYRLADLPDPVSRYSVIREYITYGIGAVIMLLAALLFFRIAMSGIPFSAKNVRTVRIIGILFLLNAVIPSVIIGGVITPFYTANYTSLIEGLLLLFITHVIRYGAVLQQESDETL